MPKKTTQKDDQVAELTADLQRVHAEFVNYKVRSEKEKTDAINIGKEHIISELLPVFDNIHRAFQHMPESLADEPWVKGIASLEKQLNSALQSIGLERIKTVGEVFSPETMDAVSVDDAGGSEEIVTTELQAGYKYAGRVIRPAMVQVKR